MILLEGGLRKEVWDMGGKKNKNKKEKNKMKKPFYNDQLGENAHEGFEKNYDNK